ncbi:hypothetical protein [Methylobacterium sp. WL19]|uniref:hypothetical protein n=1 Tax=Methylobacterium sp. WL19 TaxID=2603896 RepID=UPI0011CB4422|nr:hypothetical protein [Methylobacterium sp. WL19]TXN20024.1 hypothetical protein FV220_24485 [Methylobacterium sp. WL19]
MRYLIWLKVAVFAFLGAAVVITVSSICAFVAAIGSLSVYESFVTHDINNGKDWSSGRMLIVLIPAISGFILGLIATIRAYESLSPRFKYLIK